MKKIIAKGMAAFLMVLMVMALIAPICNAEEMNNNVRVVSHLGKGVTVDINKDTYVVMVTNHTNAIAYDLNVRIFTESGWLADSDCIMDLGRGMTFVILDRYVDVEVLKEAEEVKIHIWGKSEADKEADEFFRGTMLFFAFVIIVIIIFYAIAAIAVAIGDFLFWYF